MKRQPPLPSTPAPEYKFTGGVRERATIAAALTLYQRHLDADAVQIDIAEMAASCDGRPPLDSDEVQVLIQEIGGY